MSNLDDNRKQMLERCVTSCHQTLRKLQALVIKYKELGIGDGLQFWKRIRWVNKKNELADMKARILAHTCQISLCMSSMGNSSLSRIEASLQMALERQEAAVTPPEHEDNSPLIHKPRVMPSETMEADDPRLNRLSRQFTGTTIADVPRRSITTLSSTPPKGNEPDFGASVIASRGRRVTSASENKRNRSTSMSLDPRVGPPSPFVSEDGTLDLEKRRSGESSTLRDREVSISGEDPYLKSAIDTAMGELSKVRQQEQQSRPLRIPPQRNIPLPDGELKAEFESHVQEEMDYRRLNTKDWLRIGTWWLLKARFHLQTMERSGTTSPRGSVVASIYSSVSSAQAYVDLLKASWILFEVILKGDYSIPLQADENRKLFYNLSDVSKILSYWCHKIMNRAGYRTAIPGIPKPSA